ncbi:hypothetical protein EMCRGX_G023943 [Ephydatia muelleri]
MSMAYSCETVRPEKLKSLLEKEENCLLRARELIEKQLAILQAEAVTMQRMLSAQHSRPELDTQSTSDDSSTVNSGQLPALNLEVSAASQRSKGNEEREEDEEEEDEDMEVEMWDRN